jgi:hypothetical protein
MWGRGPAQRKQIYIKKEFSYNRYFALIIGKVPVLLMLLAYTIEIFQLLFLGGVTSGAQDWLTLS